MSLLLDSPAPGTGLLACEGDGDQIAVSVWLYLYGDDAPELVARDQPRWDSWLRAHAT
jgi:hypothetical protein